MDYLTTVSQGLLLVLSWPNLLFPLGGTFLAMIVSFLPGVSGVTLMALALPLTLGLEPVQVILLYGAFVGGATFMGSITAILFNVPGAAPNAATMLDGHPLARRGEARTAIGCAAAASASGSIVGVVVLFAVLPPARSLLLSFGPLEFLLLGLWGLCTVVMVGRASVFKGVAMVGLGLALALVGRDPRTAEPRWTLGSDYLVDGLPLVPVLLGIFAIAEMIHLIASKRERIADLAGNVCLGGSVREGALAVVRHPILFLRCSMIGTLVGIIPGIGGTVASFVAYGHAVQTARPPTRFGEGDIRGVLAPEAAHDAKDGGSLLPVLAFGLPGSEGTAVLLAVLVLHGFVPGREMLDAQLVVSSALIWALLLSNCLTSVVGVLMARQLARITQVRTVLLIPWILGLVAVASIGYRGNPLDLLLACAFGLFGYLLSRFGWPRVPFVIAFVLATVIEDNLLLFLRLHELGRIGMFDRPVAMVLAGLLVLTFGCALLRFARTRATLGPEAS